MRPPISPDESQRTALQELVAIAEGPHASSGPDGRQWARDAV